MTQRPRPHRPRPHPGPAVSAGVGDTAPELPSAHRPRPGVVSVPAAATPRVPALWHSLRRDPLLPRRASIATIAAGGALFVVATLTSPLAGADAGNRSDASPVARDAIAAPQADAATAYAGTESAEPVRAVDKQDAKSKAPIDHGAISALAANGIPKVALNAYRVAAARMANVDPGCGIDWSLIAGIGREESDHGRFAGSVLHADGTSTPRIVGPALTGAVWEYFGAAPEYISVTGDRKYAHALGPMQFIPTTWDGYGADATGDGKADIFNINDAALGTARYLCAAGGDLTTRAGQVKAVLTYNHNDQYLAQVLALADAYSKGVPITGIPVGITSGALPKVKPGKVPPANPGAPTAADPTRHKKKTPTHSSSAPAPRPSSSRPSSGGGSSSRPSSNPTPTRTTPKPSPSSSRPGSSTPAPSPSTSLKNCNPLEKAADMLLPPSKRKCK